MIIFFTITIIVDIFLLIKIVKEVIKDAKYYENKSQLFIEIIKILPFILLLLLPIINILFIYDYFFKKEKKYRDEEKIRRKKEYEMSITEKYNILVKTLIDCGYFKNYREVIQFIESGKIMDALTKDYSQDN
jgi:predicted membrane protein